MVTLLQISSNWLFGEVKQELGQRLLKAPLQHRNKWQQMDVESSDLHATHELANVIISIDQVSPGIKALQAAVQPDLPWAEDHFWERVGGHPVNPGAAHAYWPYHGASIQATLRGMGTRGEHYDHNYMERMWCKGIPGFGGYRFEPGDLGSVVDLLTREPTTRQAFLPIWFPEDTGVQAGQRVPCTLGYHFILRDGKLHMTYFLRACEWYRHFTNDVYLAIRLQQWVANQVGDEVGSFTMHVADMHLFKGDEGRV